MLGSGKDTHRRRAAGATHHDREVGDLEITSTVPRGLANMQPTAVISHHVIVVVGTDTVTLHADPVPRDFGAVGGPRRRIIGP